MATDSSQPDHDMTLPEALAEIERLRSRIVEYEALAAVARGSLTEPPPGVPFHFEEVPPNTPR